MATNLDNTVIATTGAGQMQVDGESGMTLTVAYSPQSGDSKVLYGLNGTQPNTPLPTGQTQFPNVGQSLQISYSVGSAPLKLAWGFGTGNS